MRTVPTKSNGVFYVLDEKEMISKVKIIYATVIRTVSIDKDKQQKDKHQDRQMNLLELSFI
jgi:hypothetical protein